MFPSHSFACRLAILRKSPNCVSSLKNWGGESGKLGLTLSARLVPIETEPRTTIESPNRDESTLNQLLVQGGAARGWADW